MISSPVLKIVALSSVGGGGLFAALAISSPKLFSFDSPDTQRQDLPFNTNSKKQIVLKVTDNLTTPSDPTSLTSGTTNRNYFCQSVKTKNNAKTTLSVDESCDLVQLTIDTTNKWMDLTGVKQTKTTNFLTLSDARTNTNYFRLDTTNNLFFSTDLSDSDISIEVVSKASPSVTLAKFSPLFKVDDGQPVFHKTKHAIGRANTTVASVESGSKCTLNKSASSDAVDCVLTAFGASVGSITGAGYRNQTFTYSAPTTQSSPVTQNHYYLIDFNADSHGLTQQQLKTTHINFVKTTSGSTSSQTLLSDVLPIILVGTDTDKKAFILSETPLFSVVVKKTTAPETAKILTVSGETKNYQCRIQTTKENCTLFTIAFDSSKHLLDVAGLNKLDGSASVTIQADAAPKTYYKLEVSDTLFSKLTGPLSSHTIDIVEELKDGESDPAKPIASFTPFITIDNNNTIAYDKSTYIVHGATLLAGSELTKTGVFDKTKTHWCSFSTTGTPDSSAKKCTLSEFSSTGPFGTETGFSQDLSETSSPIDATKLYLINFIDDADGIAKPDPLANKIFYFEEGDEGQAKTPIASFSEIIPVVLVETADSKKSAFVLK